MDIQPNDIWIAAGVLLGFQVTSFAARINREIAVGEWIDITWLPPSDILNLFSMVILIVGIFILPVFDFVDQVFMTYAFGLAVLLFMGFAFGLAGHYDMYNNESKRSYRYFPPQEKIVVAVIVVLAITYVIIATVKIGGWFYVGGIVVGIAAAIVPVLHYVKEKRKPKLEVRAEVTKETLALGNGQKITVTVKDAKSEKPVGDAKIVLHIKLSDPREDRTDENGQLSRTLTVNNTFEPMTYELVALVSAHGYKDTTNTTRL